MYIDIYIYIIYIPHICAYYICIYTNSRLPVNATVRHYPIVGKEITRARKHLAQSAEYIINYIIIH